MARRRKKEKLEDTAIERDLSRYSRQMMFEPIGQAGQERLLESKVALIGCGALGTVLASSLVRAGVGFLRIADRDFIEPNNLQRQVLFNEDDIASNLPKAEAARRRLSRVNSDVTVEAVVADIDHHNIESLASGVDLLLDGTDNFETRFLINDLAVKTNRPWIYGACVAATGLSMPVIPHETPCLRCIFEQGPPPELNPTCDTSGILGPVVNRVASHQSLEAIKILIGRKDALDRRLLQFDAWTGRYVQIDVQKAYEAGDCPCCKQGRYEYLEGQFASTGSKLCGREAVQIVPPEMTTVNFTRMADKLRPVADGDPRFNPFMLKVSLDGCEMTLFPDGRAIIKGTDDVDYARGLYARYIGS